MSGVSGPVSVFGAKIQPFLVNGTDGALNSLFVQEEPLSPGNGGPGLVSRFTNFPPLPIHGQSGVLATRGYFRLSPDAVVKLGVATSLNVALYALALAIRRRIALDPSASDIEIEAGDIEFVTLSLDEAGVPEGGRPGGSDAAEVLPQLLCPGDITVSPTRRGYVLGHVEEDADRSLTWLWFGDTGTWDEAVDLARKMAVQYGVRAWGQQNGGPCVELVLAYDTQAPWTAPWFPFTSASIAQAAPHEAGVYLIGRGRPAFVGDTDDLGKRLAHHGSALPPCLQRISPLLFSFQRASHVADRPAVIEDLITRWRPPCNQTA